MAHGTALYIGAVLGTGVIALPALAARAVGPASLLAGAGLLVLSVPLTATFAAPGARYPDVGSVSTYARNAFAARPAAVVGWCFYLAMPAGVPAAALFAGAYVAAAAGGGRASVLATAAAVIVVGARYLAVAAATILVLGPAAGRPAAPLADLLARGLGGPARGLAAEKQSQRKTESEGKRPSAQERIRSSKDPGMDNLNPRFQCLTVPLAFAG